MDLFPRSAVDLCIVYAPQPDGVLQSGIAIESDTFRWYGLAKVSPFSSLVTVYYRLPKRFPARARRALC